VNFTHQIRVLPTDIDAMGHVNNVVYVRWVQEVAAAHWEAVASTHLKERFKWVVLRHEIDYLHPVFENQTITGTTWVGEHHGAKFERFVLLESEGRAVARAKTVWCMLDAVNGRPVRITDEVLAVL
jgi:acyl-CoA thioester hydrolase